MSTYIIETKELTKTFKSSTAVNRVNLQIPKGEIYGFLGPNGAGKTTTIRMLLGLMKATSGSISIFGKDLVKEKLKILSKVGSLVESPSYYAHLSAIENLEVMRRILGVPSSRIHEVLSIVRLEKDAKRPVSGFSLGMKQRLGIAASLLGHPELIILDEPTNGLDPSGIIEMREFIKSLPEQHGVTVLVSSHLLSEIDQIATQVGVISKVSLIFQDSIDVLRNKSINKIRIQTNDCESSWRYLVSNGWTADLEENEIFIKENNNKQVAHIVRSLVEQQFDVYRVEENRMSLESIF
jgi:ABC-type multidrug transport system ATPase subunit